MGPLGPTTTNLGSCMLHNIASPPEVRPSVTRKKPPIVKHNLALSHSHGKVGVERGVGVRGNDVKGPWTGDRRMPAESRLRFVPTSGILLLDEHINITEFGFPVGIRKVLSKK
jgi:hypothetical protein